MAVDARARSTTNLPVRAPWWKRKPVLVPLSIAGIAALTAAAVVSPLYANRFGTSVEPDADIPIRYITDSGVEVNCRYGIYFGDPEARNDTDEQLAEFVHNHDWTGIGQRIYDEALANPAVPGDEETAANQEAQDVASFMIAFRLIHEELPNDLRHANHRGGAGPSGTILRERSSHRQYPGCW